jgi:putative acetyltransferase
MITVEKGDPRHPEATALLRASHALMQELFPAETNHFLSIDALCAPEIAFFVAKLGEQTVGTGALAHKGDYGEVKSMFTDPEARGSGAAGAILTAIEDEARAQGLPLIRLETGDTLHAAHRLYQRHGFAFRGPFGAYEDIPESLFMEKAL